MRTSNLIPFPLQPCERLRPSIVGASARLFLVTRPVGPVRQESESVLFDEFAVWANRFGRRVAAMAPWRQAPELRGAL